jgi:hypothetical protein
MGLCVSSPLIQQAAIVGFPSVVSFLERNRGSLSRETQDGQETGNLFPSISNQHDTCQVGVLFPKPKSLVLDSTGILGLSSCLKQCVLRCNPPLSGSSKFE